MSRRIAIWLLLVVVFIAAIASAAASGSGARAGSLSAMGVTFHGTRIASGGSHAAHVALVPIEGTIVDGHAAGGSDKVGGDDLVALLKAIERSHRYDGVLLEVDTPGGAVLASDETARELRELRHHGMPVVAWMRSTAASGGYYISSQADRIVAHDTTVTGSIGVILEYLDVAGLADKVGVKAVVVKSGKLKDMGSPYRQMTPQERAILQRLIDQAYGDFVHTVAVGRHLTEARVRKLGDGRIYTGRDAKAVGLVDELGDRGTAYAAIEALVRRRRHSANGVDVVRFEQPVGLLSALGVAASGQLHLGALGELARSLGLGAGVADSATSGDAVQAGDLPRIEYRAVL